MTTAALGVTLLVTASVGVVVYGLSLWRLLHRPHRRGLVRTATCRVGAAVLYGAIAVATLLGAGLGDATALVVFIAVQLVWMVNSIADAALTRQGQGRTDSAARNPREAPVQRALPRRVRRRTRAGTGQAEALVAVVVMVPPLTEWWFRARVRRVVDADTLAVAVDAGFDVGINVTIRVQGVDAPELRTPAGNAAARFVEGLLSDPRVTLRTEFDRTFARWVGEVWLSDGRSLADVLVAGGHGTRSE